MVTIDLAGNFDHSLLVKKFQVNNRFILSKNIMINKSDTASYPCHGCPRVSVAEIVWRLGLFKFKLAASVLHVAAYHTNLNVNKLC